MKEWAYTPYSGSEPGFVCPEMLSSRSDGGTSGFDLLPLLEDADHLIVIDALRCQAAPGTVVILRNEEVPAFFKTKLSPHQVGLSDVLAMLSFKGSAPRSVTLLGAVPSEISLGMELSPAVSLSVDRLLATVVDELTRLGVECETRPEAFEPLLTCPSAPPRPAASCLRGTQARLRRPSRCA